jgi:hypothetical protein
LHLLRSDRPYQLRAITRETSNPAAKHLESQGVHVVRANMNSSADLERAFEGADVVFVRPFVAPISLFSKAHQDPGSLQGVTDFWAHMSFDKEVEDGKRIVDAVNKAEVSTFLWSALEPVKDLSKGTITGVEHFDSKVSPLLWRTICEGRSRDLTVQLVFLSGNHHRLRIQLWSQHGRRLSRLLHDQLL